MLLGLSWFKGSSVQTLRHSCNEKDGFTRWGFVKADDNYGKQVFVDGDIKITTEHIIQSKDSMIVRVNGSFVGKSKETGYLSMLVNFQSPNGVIIDGYQDGNKGVRGQTVMAKTGDGIKLRIDWGAYNSAFDSNDVCTEQTVRLREGKLPPEFTRTHYTGWLDQDYTVSWNLMQKLKTILEISKESAKRLARNLFQIYDPSDEHKFDRIVIPLLNDKIERESTTVIFQRILPVPFSFNFTINENIETNPSVFMEREMEFDNQFEATYNFSVKPHYSSDYIEMAKYALGNTIGSIGYFFGSVIYEDYTFSPPGSLITGMPSRSFFPRGFLWDEGFHQLIVSSFNKALAKTVISSWLDRFDQNGWVAREQILGLEAIDRVPPEFLVQNRLYANPPALLLGLDRFLNEEKPDLVFLRKVFQKFSKHRDWLIKTQKSKVATGLMAWKGRSSDGKHTLTSGLDDYPRGTPKDLDQEAHVDLLAWAAWEDLILAEIAKKLDLKKETEDLLKSYDGRVELLLKKHWNPKLKFFNDIGYEGNFHGFISKVGYVGLIPFALKLIPIQEEVKIRSIVSHLQNTDTLRAPKVGIRSLSLSDPLFGEGENYWRGAVWININYLCIQALKYYSLKLNELSYLELARELSRDLVENVNHRFHKDGYLFESYDSITGKGRGTKPFTGWTALVILLMNEDF